VFLALWRALPRYDPHLGPVRAWLMAMARSRAVDQLRRRARERLHAAGPVDAAVGELAADEAVGDDRHLDRASVRAAMRDLPPDQRRALYLVYFLGLSQSEAARRLLVPLGTLKGRIRLSVGRLRRLFDAGPRGR
jgi:RNA polymerase sigma-70 factor (ECF subfamily)